MKTESEQMSVLLFYVNGVLCMLPVNTVTSIEMPQRNIAPVPDMPAYVYGVCHVKGRNIALVDLQKVLRFNVHKEDTVSVKQSVIVLEEKIGLLTGQVVGVDLIEHFDKSSNNVFCGKMVDRLYTLGAAIRDYYHIQDKDSIVFGLNLPEIFAYINHNKILDNVIEKTDNGVQLKENQVFHERKD